MKTLIFFNKIFWLIAAICLATAVFNSCSDNDKGGGKDPDNPNPSQDFNKVFGGAGDDYTNPNGIMVNRRDIKLASDGTIWMCGSTASSDGDLSAAGNKGGVDAWLLHVNPKTNQILYNRTFGGSDFDELCSILLMSDGTVWVCGDTKSSDGDLAAAGHHFSTPGSNNDGWVMHIDPTTDQILYNRCIGGSANDFFYNIAIDSDNKTIYLCGETLSFLDDNTGNGFHGGTGTDAWLVGIESNQNESAALTYNRCFGGAQPDAFLQCRLCLTALFGAQVQHVLLMAI